MGCYGDVNYEIIDKNHTCIGKHATFPCPACELEKELSVKKEKGEIIDFFQTGGRYPSFVVIKETFHKTDDVVVCEQFLSSNGWWTDVVVKGEKIGVMTYTYGQTTFYPYGAVLEELPATVHGASKIATHQTQLIIAYRKVGDSFLYTITENAYDITIIDKKTKDVYICDYEGTRKINAITNSLTAKSKTRKGGYYFGRARELGIDNSNKAVVGNKEIINPPIMPEEYDKVIVLKELF